MVLLQRDHRRSGVALVLCVVLLFGLLALAALVIDHGFVRNSQMQMQTAVESAALEGLHGFDPDNPADDQEIREKARERLFHVFDDDFDEGDGDARNYGAGPVINLSGGIKLGSSSFYASQLITIPPTPVYDPSDAQWPFQLNMSNDKGGDIVRGIYMAPNSDDAPVKETSDYDREDFEATSPDKASAFLVRMRRSTEGSSSDTRSSGPPLPLLFGRGSVLNPKSKIKEDGITVRATAIAEGRRAMSVGPALPAALYPDASPPFAGLPGATPFALNVDFWINATPGVANPIEVDATGLFQGGTGQMIRITSTANAIAATDTTLNVRSAAGFPDTAPFYVRVNDELMRVTAASGATWTVERGVDETVAKAHEADHPILLHEDLTIARTLIVVERPQKLNLLTGVGFHSYAPIIDTTGRTLGFGWVEWSVSESWSGDFKLSLTKLDFRKVAVNASVVSTRLLGPLLEGLPDAAVEDFFKAHGSLKSALLAPALVR
jgi:hypothetical protein